MQQPSADQLSAAMTRRLQVQLGTKDIEIEHLSVLLEFKDREIADLRQRLAELSAPPT